ncbi:MAG TPA: AGE family epimerase/isomerase [Solirubrobacteraceae bacterium]|nr:AGE family epimerase/isomerase [Solirubrobacteraceae bacterium]
MSWRERPDHRRFLAAESERLLEFARAARVPGGYAWLDETGTPDLQRPLQLWICTRMVHVFALGDLLGRPGCGPLADHGLAALRDVFADGEHGGWYGEVAGGRPTSTDKTAYEHAFVLLAASSATVAGRPGAEALLGEAAAVVEERFWSDAQGICVEAWDRAWTQLDSYRGANANMHMVEAFLAAADATGDRRWAARALRIATALIDRHARANGWRVPEHYDAELRPDVEYNADRPRDRFRPYGVTPGHALEWSRLLLHLHAALRDPPAWLRQAAAALFARAVEDGWEATGGFVYTTGHDGRPAVRERFHWVVAEAIGAAAALHAVTGDDAYDGWYRAFWDFADLHLRDRVHGGWRSELDADNRPSAATWPGKADTYHAFQATLVPRLPLAPGMALALRDAAPDLTARRNG